MTAGTGFYKDLNNTLRQTPPPPPDGRKERLRPKVAEMSDEREEIYFKSAELYLEEVIQKGQAHQSDALLALIEPLKDERLPTLYNKAGEIFKERFEQWQLVCCRSGDLVAYKTRVRQAKRGALATDSVFGYVAAAEKKARLEIAGVGVGVISVASLFYTQLPYYLKSLWLWWKSPDFRNLEKKTLHIQSDIQEVQANRKKSNQTTLSLARQDRPSTPPVVYAQAPGNSATEANHKVQTSEIQRLRDENNQLQTKVAHLEGKIEQLNDTIEQQNGNIERMNDRFDRLMQILEAQGRLPPNQIGGQ